MKRVRVDYKTTPRESMSLLCDLVSNLFIDKFGVRNYERTLKIHKIKYKKSL